MSTPRTQCGVRFSQLGGPEVLEVHDVPVPRPGRNEVLLEVRSIGVTQGDAMYRQGTYLEKPDLPSGIGTAVCGQIVELGPDVSALNVGDRVSTVSSASINRYPLYGEFAVVPTTSLVATPPSLTDAQGSAFALAHLPMWIALFHVAGLKQGEWLVSNAARSTTSVAACQLARVSGGRTVGVVRSRSAAEAVAHVGYDAVLVAGPGLAEDIVDVTDGGADVVLDPVLGDGAEALYEAAGHQARIIHYGALAGTTLRTSVYPLVKKQLTVRGFTIYQYTGSQILGLPRDEMVIKRAMRGITDAVARGSITPTVADEMPLKHVADAHRRARDGRHVGTLTLTP